MKMYTTQGNLLNTQPSYKEGLDVVIEKERRAKNDRIKNKEIDNTENRFSSIFKADKTPVI